MPWWNETGYGRRSLAETDMNRDKGIIGNRLHARSWPARHWPKPGLLLPHSTA
jgi:hypothetical protein